MRSIKENGDAWILPPSKSLRTRRAIADAVEYFVIAVAHQSLLCESFDCGILRDAAWTGDADDFAFEVVDA